MGCFSKKSQIRLGIIGLSDGNGHPYSWSAIFNGYDEKAMSQCPFPVIPQYLEKQCFPMDCILNAKVTHVWTQNKNISNDIAAASKIDHVVDHYEEMIGKVDAILLARDDAESHLPMSRPFLEAGLPVYIDKPIATDLKTLRTILEYEKYPGQIFSCSALRYAKEFSLSQDEWDRLGDIKYVVAETGKNWEKYSVHLIDPVLNLLKLSGEDASVQVIHVDHKHVAIARWPNMTVQFATLGDCQLPITIRIYGTKAMKTLTFSDTFFAFKRALEVFIHGVMSRSAAISHYELRSVVSIIERGMSHE